MSREKLSRDQLSALDCIDRYAEDAYPELQANTGRWPVTHRSLVRRGLITAEHDSGVPGGWWRYALTYEGREALLSTRAFELPAEVGYCRATAANGVELVFEDLLLEGVLCETPAGVGVVVAQEDGALMLVARSGEGRTDG